MRQWAAGVTVITVGKPGEVHGMTANSFTSVSCTPPLMLFCVGLSNDTHALVKIGETVGINLLSDSQIDICGRFATKTEARYKFDDLASFTGPKGATLFSGCAAVMEAVVAQAHVAGDHTIFIGEIVFAETDETKKPLVYSQGALARLHPLSPPALATTTPQSAGQGLRPSTSAGIKKSVSRDIERTHCRRPHEARS
jgi:flavin reductase (DIM6/NTAB) family NADH-FMN oxidoreductase RutF